MRKGFLCIVVLSVLVFALAGISQAGQGRMGGMGDPYGLIADDSDFLIHPMKIAKGEGIKFYGHYRFTYTDVMEWDYDLDRLDSPAYYHYDTSGQEYAHDALVGAAFPLGPGRMGVFFSYDGMRGDYDGDEDTVSTPNFAEYDLTKDLDAFALRLLYGLPVLGMDLGVELGMAYQDEKQETWLTTATSGFTNYLLSWAGGANATLFPFMIPYDSNYWELLWKAGLGKQFDAKGIDVSLRGGFIISSDNNYEYKAYQPIGAPPTRDADMEGDVAGWRIGSDIWFRYGLRDGMTLPFLVSFDYAEKKRDGDAIGLGTADGGVLYDYDHKETALDLKVGGGLEKELGGNALLAAGIYYNYLQGSDDVCFTRPPSTWDHSDFPSNQEHLVILRLAGEKEFSSIVALRMGLDFFYGWVQKDYELTYVSGANYTDAISLDGYHWGIGGSLGSTLNFNGFTMEPFFNVGWQQYDLDGDGNRTGTATALYDMDLSRSEWYIGGGCSFLFDMP